MAFDIFAGLAQGLGQGIQNYSNAIRQNDMFNIQQQALAAERAREQARWQQQVDWRNAQAEQEQARWTQEQQNKLLSRLSDNAILSGNPEAIKSLQDRGIDPYMYASPELQVKIMEGQENRAARAEDRDWRRYIQGENLRLRQEQLAMQAGKDKTRYSTATINTESGPMIVAFDPANPSEKPIPIGPAAPNVAGDSVFNREMDKKAAADFFKMQNVAETAQKSLLDLDAAEQIIASGLYTGAGGEAYHNLIRRPLAALGISGGEYVAAGELLQKIQNEMALVMRSPDSGMGLPGSASDKDIQFLKDAQIGLGRSPEANMKFIDMARKVKQRQIDVANMASEYINQNGKLDQQFYLKLRQWSNENSMFDEPSTGTESADQAADRIINQYGGRK